MCDHAHKVCGVSFSAYTEDEIRNLSIKSLTNPDSFDLLGHPMKGGLYDAAMGPIGQRDRCSTCGLLGLHCPGHMGHIELPLPVYHPAFFVKQLKLLDHGLLVEAKKMERILDAAASASADAAADEDGDDVAATSAAVDDVEETITQHYLAALAAAGLSPDTPAPKHAKYSHVNKFKDELKRAFMANCIKNRTCTHCATIARTLITEGQKKIIAKPLLKKHQLTMISKGCVEVFLHEGSEGGAADKMKGKGKGKGKGKAAANADEVVNDSDDGGDSDDTSSDDGSVVSDDDAIIPGAGESATGKWDQQRIITPDVAQEHLRLLWQNEDEVVKQIFGLDDQAVKSGPGGVLFLTVIPVPGCRFRPPSVMGDATFENPHTLKLVEVLKACRTIRDVDISQVDSNRFTNNWIRLQECVNVMVDSGLGGVDEVGGIKQVLEKKEGLFRMHMMGKRVNYACRSVIGPDPMIGTHEVGIPGVFSTKLTYPESVTAFNVHVLREAVINGPDRHPGATHVEDVFGRLQVLSKTDKAAREAVAAELLLPPDSTCGLKRKYPAKRVMRHIKNGDYVLVNRQPTLHKASLMAHQARILLGERTLRLHYANCKTYNADFDGDEMNVHFPQSEVARAEAATIAFADQQYISLGGSPLRGLIQDHIVSALRMLCQDGWYNREAYHNLIYAACGDSCGRLILLPPAMLKPKRLWTGKQLVTTMLANLCKGKQGVTLSGKSQTNNSWSASTQGPLLPESLKGAPAGAFSDKFELEGEGKIMFRDGVFLCGLLDKKHIGAAKKGLVHTVQELYGNTAAGSLLSMLTTLFTQMLKSSALTFGIEDVLLTPEAEAERRTLLAAATACGPIEARGYTNTQSKDEGVLLKNIETIFRDEKEMAALDAVMMAANNTHQTDIVRATCPAGLAKPFPGNHLQAMIQTGAKGSSVNATQISSLLGQQALEGKRVPVMVSGKTLPSYTAFDPGARAGGMILGRFLTGIKPQDYYFHCMAGREGLVDTAVKTSRSGYLQRCLVKHLEDLTVQYDLTVRDADGSVVQFLYGEDGLDVSKTAQLTNFDFMAENYVGLLDKFAARNLDALFPGKYATKGPKAVKKARKKPGKYPPALSEYGPDRYFGCVSEKFQDDIDGHIKRNADEGGKIRETHGGEANGGTTVTSEKLEQLALLKSYRSLVDPGEAVGVLAAQAIGEPSTQMTLNTFHFAGRSDMNVTLGIPRLREILMTASPKIKTPIITAMLNTSPKALKNAGKLADRLGRVTLKEVLQRVHVTDHLSRSKGGLRHRVYDVRLQLIPKAEAKKKFAIKQSQVMHRLEEWLSVVLPKIFRKELSDDAAGKAMVVQGDAEEAAAGNAESAKQAPNKGELSDDSDDDSEADDGNADADGTLESSARARRAQGGAYDDDDEEEEEEDGKLDPDDVPDSDDDMDADSDAEVAAEAAAAAAKLDSSSSSSSSKKLKKSSRSVNVVQADECIAEYDYNDDEDWCQIQYKIDSKCDQLMFVSLIEECAHNVVIRAVEGINKCGLGKTKQTLDEPDSLMVDGTNLRELWKHSSCLDVNSIKTNNIFTMLDIYGVEAARHMIVSEVNGVFAVYGIEVDPRHMSLVADAMTQAGGYNAMNRMGLRANASPLLKMSFETTFDFLRNATLSGDHDELKSSSSRIVVGQPSLGGTGCFGLYTKLGNA